MQSASCVVLLLTASLGWVAGYRYVTQHITVPVDHFSFANNATFPLRYLINDTYWEKGGPIFFYTGNEGDITMFAENTGFMWEIAPEFNALVVFAEHRYYGESLPFGNKSFSNPEHVGYLTALQALADYVDLIIHLRERHPGAQNSPVIAFGGSYGGMLAAWFRMKYPHIISGSIASSAPIRQFTGLVPCEAFNRIVTSSFTGASQECSKTIKRSWSLITNMSSTDAGKTWLSTEWKLCNPLKTSSDVDALKNWLNAVYVNLAMVNYPYPSNFLAPLPGNPVKAVCKNLLDSSLTDKLLLKSLHKGISVYFNYTGNASCMNYTEDATAKLGERGWDFQSCTEMVMPICANGEDDMFERQPWNPQRYSDECYKRWKVRPQPFYAENLYGTGDDVTTSNIIFTNGLLDPWSSGGVLHNLSATAIAIMIPEAAHHLDLRASNPADPPSVVSARKIERRAIRSWIQQTTNSIIVSEEERR